MLRVMTDLLANLCGRKSLSHQRSQKHLHPRSSTRAMQHLAGPRSSISHPQLRDREEGAAAASRVAEQHPWPDAQSLPGSLDCTATASA
jgi:hypothetical protein